MYVSLAWDIFYELFFFQSFVTKSIIMTWPGDKNLQGLEEWNQVAIFQTSYILQFYRKINTHSLQYINTWQSLVFLHI